MSEAALATPRMERHVTGELDFAALVEPRVEPIVDLAHASARSAVARMRSKSRPAGSSTARSAWPAA